MTLVLVGCAVVLTGFAARNQLRDTRPPLPEATVPSWREMAAVGHRRGPTSAPSVILEFADFQCTACERVRFSIDSVLARHPDDVALVYRHFPLRLTHPHSDAAANAAECAAAHGRFFEFATALFDEQNYIGRRAWSHFASRAGITDSTAFSACVDARTFASTVDRDAALADSIGVLGTPTLIINGRILAGAVSAAQIERALQANDQ